MLLQNVLGWMTNQELSVLNKISKLIPDDGVIVEVGSMFGRSACVWASSKPLGKIYCIDIFYEKYDVTHNIPTEICLEHSFPLNGQSFNILEEFQKNTKNFPNINMIRGCSPFVKYDGPPIDLFFLDASHTNPNDWENIEYFLPLIKDGGIISGHDYIPDVFPDVVENVKRLEKMFNTEVTLYTNTSIWSFHKIKV